MARLRRNPVPVRLEVHYEYVPVRYVQPGIDVLAVMLREVKAEIEREKQEKASSVLQGETTQ